MKRMTSHSMVQAVVVLALRKKGGGFECLTVSRKHDATDVGLPGGKVDAGETPLAAAMRELHEETGHAAQDLLIEVMAANGDTGADWVEGDMGCLTTAFVTLISDDEPQTGALVADEPQAGALALVADDPQPQAGESGVVRWLPLKDALVRPSSFAAYNRRLWDLLGKKLNMALLEHLAELLSVAKGARRGRGGRTASSVIALN